MNSSIRDTDVERTKQIAYKTIEDANKAMRDLVATFKEGVEKLHEVAVTSEDDYNTGPLFYTTLPCKQAFVEEVEKWIDDITPIQASIDQLLQWINSSMSEGFDKILHKKQIIQQARQQKLRELEEKYKPKELKIRDSDTETKSIMSQSSSSNYEELCQDIRFPAIISPEPRSLMGDQSIPVVSRNNSKKTSTIHHSRKPKAKMLEFRTYKDTRVTKYRKEKVRRKKQEELEQEEIIRIRCKRQGVRINRHADAKPLGSEPKPMKLSIATRKRRDRMKHQISNTTTTQTTNESITNGTSSFVVKKSGSECFLPKIEQKQCYITKNASVGNKTKLRLPPLSQNISLTTHTVSCARGRLSDDIHQKQVQNKISAPNTTNTLIGFNTTVEKSSALESDIEHIEKSETLLLKDIERLKEKKLELQLKTETNKKKETEAKQAQFKLQNRSGKFNIKVVEASAKHKYGHNYYKVARRSHATKIEDRPPWNGNNKVKLNTRNQNVSKDRVSKENSKSAMVSSTKKQNGVRRSSSGTPPNLIQKAKQKALDVFKRRFNKASDVTTANNIQDKDTLNKNNNVKIIEGEKQKNGQMSRKSKPGKCIKKNSAVSNKQTVAGFMRRESTTFFHGNENLSSHTAYLCKSETAVSQPNHRTKDANNKILENTPATVSRTKQESKETKNSKVDSGERYDRRESVTMRVFREGIAKSKANAERVRAALERNSQRTPSDFRGDEILKKYSSFLEGSDDDTDDATDDDKRNSRLSKANGVIIKSNSAKIRDSILQELLEVSADQQHICKDFATDIENTYKQAERDKEEVCMESKTDSADTAHLNSRGARRKMPSFITV